MSGKERHQESPHLSDHTKIQGHLGNRVSIIGVQFDLPWNLTVDLGFFFPPNPSNYLEMHTQHKYLAAGASFISYTTVPSSFNH